MAPPKANLAYPTKHTLGLNLYHGTWESSTAWENRALVNSGHTITTPARFSDQNRLCQMPGLVLIAEQTTVRLQKILTYVLRARMRVPLVV